MVSLGTSAGPVPVPWHGLWRRLALERPDGSGDTTTLVLWLQTATLYADLRIPADRPSFVGVTGFAELDAAQCDWLARQQAFAGRLHADGDRAHWARRIDLAPLAGPPDEGHLIRDRRMLVEHGVHADYVEHWWCEIDAPTTVAIDRPAALLVRAGATFMLAVDRRPAPPAPGALAAAVGGAKDAASRAALLDCEVSFGHAEGRGYRIVHSTLPWREGAVFPDADTLLAIR